MINHYQLYTLVLFAYLCGCSSLQSLKLPGRNEVAPDKARNAPTSQLGVALPAMKRGDERELKIIAGDQMVENGYWQEAIELFLDAESMAPKKPRLDRQLAPALAAVGNYAESLKRYQRLIEAESKSAKLRNNYAYTLMEAGDLEAAEKQYRIAIELDPSLENPKVNLGLMLARLEREEEAFEVLKSAVGESAAFHNLGVVAIDLGNEQAAKHYFSKSAAAKIPTIGSSVFLSQLSHR